MTDGKHTITQVDNFSSSFAFSRANGALAFIRTSPRSTFASYDLHGCSAPNRPFLLGIVEGQKKILVSRTLCKRWKCKECAERNKLHWSKKAFYGLNYYIEKGEKFFFVTITSHERLKTFEQTVYVWRKAWRKLQERVRRVVKKLGLIWHYIYLPEKHEDGRLHVHLISNVEMGESWWKDNGRACGLGYMNFEKPLRSAQQGARYVTKYVTKSLGVEDWVESFRRVNTSQNFPQLEEEIEKTEGIEWIIRNDEQLNFDVPHYWGLGYDVYNLKSGEKITSDLWLEGEEHDTANNLRSRVDWVGGRVILFDRGLSKGLD